VANEYPLGKIEEVLKGSTETRNQFSAMRSLCRNQKKGLNAFSVAQLRGVGYLVHRATIAQARTKQSGCIGFYSTAR
jgi:hypothetical protein